MPEGETTSKIDMSLPRLVEEPAATEVSSTESGETPVAGITRLLPDADPVEAVTQAINNPNNTDSDVEKRIREAARLAALQNQADQDTKKHTP